MPGMFGKTSDKEILEKIFGNPKRAVEVLRGAPAPKEESEEEFEEFEEVEEED